MSVTTQPSVCERERRARRARRQALQALAHRHPVEFRTLYDRAREDEGLRPVTSR